ncbi:MAG: preprotein translocase subunit YajC [Sandaracinaceae bacterium]
MVLTLLEILWWLQPPATTGGGGGVPSPAAGATPDDGMSCYLTAGFMALAFAFFYFVLLRPENKRREEQESFLKSLRKGMKVRTSGGLLGEIVSVNEDEVVLQLADRVRVNVLLANIASSETARKAGADASAKKGGGKGDGGGKGGDGAKGDTGAKGEARDEA